MLSLKPACCSVLILSAAAWSAPAAAVPSGASHSGELTVTEYNPGAHSVFHERIDSQPVPFNEGRNDFDYSVGASALDDHLGLVHAGGTAFEKEVQANSLIAYNWGVEGPENGVDVPVTVTFRGHLSASGNGKAETRILLLGADAPWFDSAIATSADGTGKDVTFSRVLTTSSGGNVILTMLVSAQVNLSGQCSRNVMGICDVSSANAVLDPMFTIDPAFAADYHLVGGLFDTVVPTVPEPPEWTLMIVGVAAAGAAARRRRAVSVTGSGVRPLIA
jgi:hypothetical protein